MHNALSSPETMIAANMLLHELRDLSQSVLFLERLEVEEDLIRQLISLGTTHFHEAASHDGPIES